MNRQQHFLGNSRSLASGTMRARVSELKKTCSPERMTSRDILKTILQYLHRDLQGSFQLGILLLMQKELLRGIPWLRNQGPKSRKGMSINAQIL